MEAVVYSKLQVAVQARKGTPIRPNHFTRAAHTNIISIRPLVYCHNAL